MILSTASSLPQAEPAIPAIYTELTRRLSPGTSLRYQEPLAKRTTLRVGGPADCYVEPASEADLAQVLLFCHEQNLTHFVLGRGSNLLVRDGGFRGVVISLAHAWFSRIGVDGVHLRCGAGARLKHIANEARRQSLMGFEFLEGIPGTLGGGLHMNAGAMGGELFELVVSVRVMSPGGRVLELTPPDMCVGYRHCGILKDHIALEAVLVGKPGSTDEIEARMRQLSQKRWASQPAAPSAGCMFKNPLASPAGKLIDELGLKGTRVGGARVSLEHGNFIVNDGGATARDVCELIALLQHRVREARGIDLETEVQIIGSDV